MAEGYRPTITDITSMLNGTPSSNKFTEKDIRDAVIALGYADSEGNYKYSEMALHNFGHLNEIQSHARKGKSSKSKSSESKSSESKTKKRRRRRRRRSASSKVVNK
jgi:hypothetical protein